MATDSRHCTATLLHEAANGSDLTPGRNAIHARHFRDLIDTVLQRDIEGGQANLI